MTVNKLLKEWMRVAFPKHHLFVNIRKDFIPGILRKRFGSILLVTSRYEGFSLSLVEGMSQGLVPVSYPVGVAPELIEDGKNGYIVNTFDEAKVRIEELLQDDTKRIAMAHAACASVAQFRSDRIATQLLELYKKLKQDRRQTQIDSSSSVT